MKILYAIGNYGFPLALALSGTASAQSPAMPPADAESHIQMHERMAKAHEDAAECLRSGKAPEECRAQFQSQCMKSGSQMGCGMRRGGRQQSGPPPSVEKEWEQNAPKTDESTQSGSPR